MRFRRLGRQSGHLVWLAYSCASVSDHVGLCQRKAPCVESILHNILREGKVGVGRGGGRIERGRERGGGEQGGGKGMHGSNEETIQA